jgi:hypothetical protein
MNTRLICSEFVHRLYAQVGLAIPYDPRGFIAPKDFAACPDIAVLWEIQRGPPQVTPIGKEMPSCP